MVEGAVLEHQENDAIDGVFDIIGDTVSLSADDEKEEKEGEKRRTRHRHCTHR